MKRSPLKRKTPLRNKTPLKRSGIKRRRKSDPEYERMMKSFHGRPCLVCGKTSYNNIPTVGHHNLLRSTHPEYKTEPKNVTPLCVEHHVPYAHERRAEYMEELKRKSPEQHAWILAHSHHLGETA